MWKSKRYSVEIILTLIIYIYNKIKSQDSLHDGFQRCTIPLTFADADLHVSVTFEWRPRKGGKWMEWQPRQHKSIFISPCRSLEVEVCCKSSPVETTPRLCDSPKYRNLSSYTNLYPWQYWCGSCWYRLSRRLSVAEEHTQKRRYILSPK